jgi:hypothetical protein
MTESKAVQLFERAVTATEKLTNEVRRLRLDVARLHGRIEPFVGELKATDPDEFSFPRKVTLSDVIGAVESSRRIIRVCEIDLSRIRGVIDNIDADAISREEMKPYIKG